ncbi:tripartite tricarboxylate transporter substrate binding protein [Variovorax sp. 770b2]|uniref:Bug family tripartite tricarboxylate transporter substrate binding protein n=1 Tax=Variovorax sp. 770b2 TaxID=1566271 RepID=UPI0008E9DF46|nr:tripartite tricarboxylate transporter substrate binding protein [Variovorax sp. 770b2]SFP25608.1 Tripartite-type tricarboxylate transporter, receptor component TctC [Variovorax sp. 770b2]
MNADMQRRTVLKALAATAVVSQAPAFAAAYPDKQIRMIWPFAAGGLGANLARVLADGLSQRLGQAVYVDARPGGGGIIGFQTLKAAAPDGYTVMLGTNSTSTLLPSMMKDFPFDPLKDFEHVAMVYTSGNVIVVRAESPIKSFADLRAQARANPGKLTYGSAGNGSTYHLMPALFDLLNGSKMVHVPYKGGGPAYMGLLGGETSVVFGDLSALPHVQAGKMRALAVLSKTRVPAAPDIPTTAELGMPDLVMESFYGLFAPKGTPRDIIARLNKETAATLADPRVQQQLKTLSTQAAPDTSPQYFVDQIAKETARWRPVIEASGIVAE